MGLALKSMLRTKFNVLERLTTVPAYRRTCQDPLKAQWEFLKGLLHRHRHTEFGWKYGFADIRSVREFQKRVPIHDWEEASLYIDKVILGNNQALFPPGEKIQMYALTSGTTGKAKFIPVTDTSYRLWGQYWDHTWSHVFCHAPHATDGKALYFPGDPEEGRLGKIPYGAITAKAYAQQNPITRQLYPYPYQIARVKDYEARYYAIMRVSLETLITSIPIANPSTILTLFRYAQKHREELIEDIRLGRLGHQEHMPKELVHALLPKIRPNPSRARKLEEIYRRTGDFLPKDYWENNGHPISVICFASGPMQLYTSQLKDFLGEIPLFDFGLLASEGRFSFPIGPLSEQRGCCLTLESNFFEFVPEDQIEKDKPDTLTAEEVELGKRYFLVVTNTSGLYRYNISDVVEISGFYENTPLIYFCNKGKHFSSITGEKISEYQVIEAVRSAVENTGYPMEDFTVCLHWDPVMPSYSLLKGNGKKDNDALLRKVVGIVDQRLMELNPEYRSKRQSRRLGPLCLKTVKGNAYEEQEKRKKEACHNLSQYKHVFLVSDPEFEKGFQYSSEVSSQVRPKKAEARSCKQRRYAI